MKHLLNFLFVIISMKMSTPVFSCINPEEKRFMVVSDYDTARLFYPRVRNMRSDNNERQFIDRDTKEQICNDMIDSYLFHDTVSLMTCRFHSFPSRWFDVSLTVHSGGRLQEFVFACLVRKGEWTLRYYISEEYDLHVHSDTSIIGRFIFKESRFRKEIELYGLAELPAKVLSCPDLCRECEEQLYLERKEKYITPSRRADDALCKLDSKNIARICIAVFKSNYFQDKISFPTNSKVYGICQRLPVAFQSERGKSEATKRNYDEWMLNCGCKNYEKGFGYLLSQAYRSNELLVYRISDATEDVFLEKIMTNIRLPVNYNTEITPFRPIARLSSQ